MEVESSPLVYVGEELTLADVALVARRYASVELSEGARARIRASCEWVQRVAENGYPTVYGINTGFGIFANVAISPEQSRDLMRRLIISHAAGVGEPLTEDAVRATLLVRAHALALGYSGVRVEIIEALLAMLNRRVHPVIPSKGSVGASGDLTPLSHLVLVMSRDEIDDEAESGEAFFDHERLSGKEAMARAGIARWVLEAKEGLALNNGTSVSTALAALAAFDARNLVNNSTVALSLALEALRGKSAAFDERIHRASRHREQQRIAAMVRELIHGSRLIDTGDRVQDAYSIRCGPQVIGAASEVIKHVSHMIEDEINSATDNPLIFADGAAEPEALSGGNFHGEAIALASDSLTIAVAELGSISERRIFRLCDAKLNDGLPMMLVPDGGINSGLMMAQVTAAALVSDNKTLAHPDSVDSIPTSGNQEDHVPMATNSARHAREVVWNTEQILGLEMLAAAQAIDLRLDAVGADAGTLGIGTRAAYKCIRASIPFLERDRVLHPDIERAVELLHSGEIFRASTAGFPSAQLL